MVQTQNISQHAAAAKMIRAELKKAFPGTKFSVTSKSFSMGDSVRIDWIDGPTFEAVRKISDKYQYGHFDGMVDMYEYSNDIQGLPQTKYVMPQRSLSNAAREKARAEICYGKPLFDDNDRLDWFEGGTWGSNAIYRHLADKSL